MAMLGAIFLTIASSPKEKACLKPRSIYLPTGQERMHSTQATPPTRANW